MLTRGLDKPVNVPYFAGLDDDIISYSFLVPKWDDPWRHAKYILLCLRLYLATSSSGRGWEVKESFSAFPRKWWHHRCCFRIMPETTIRWRTMINVYDRGKHDGAMIPEEIFDVHTAIAYDIFGLKLSWHDHRRFPSCMTHMMAHDMCVKPIYVRIIMCSTTVVFCWHK